MINIYFVKIGQPGQEGFQLQRDARPQAVGLLPHHTQEGHLVMSFRHQQTDGLRHGGQDPLGVAGAPAVDPGTLASGGNEGRHGIQVGAEEDSGFAPGGQQVAPAPFHGLPPEPGAEVDEFDCKPDLVAFGYYAFVSHGCSAVQF